MAAKFVPYQGNLAANSDRGPSQVIWGDCPVAEFQEDPAKGMYYWNDMDQLGGHPSTSGGVYAGPVGNMAAYLYQGGTITDAGKEGGVAVLASDGDNEGAAIAQGIGSYQLFDATNLTKQLWFECRVNSSTITVTKHDAFVGLFDGFLTSGVPTAAWPITTTDGTLASAMNAIGFLKVGSVGTDWKFVYQLSGTTMVAVTNLTTLVLTATGTALTATQYVKLGFLFDPTATAKRVTTAGTGQTVGALKRPLVRVFVNGLELKTFLTSDNTGGAAFPTGFMAAGAAVMNVTGSTPGSLAVDWIRVAQRANS